VIALKYLMAPPKKYTGDFLNIFAQKCRRFFIPMDISVLGSQLRPLVHKESSRWSRNLTGLYI